MNDKAKTYDIREICARTRLSRTSIYGEIKSGALKARKAGRRTVILAQDFEEWLEHLPLVRPSREVRR